MLGFVDAILGVVTAVAPALITAGGVVGAAAIQADAAKYAVRQQTRSALLTSLAQARAAYAAQQAAIESQRIQSTESTSNVSTAAVAFVLVAAAIVLTR